MPVTMQQIRAALDPEEPDYDRAAELGPDALPHLETLISGTDPGLAAKAASLAGMIPCGHSTDVLARAAGNDDPRVRVAVAAACRHLDDSAASGVLRNLVTDTDIGVQKVALLSVPIAASDELRMAVNTLGASVTEPGLAHMVAEVRQRIDQPQTSEEDEEMTMTAPGETPMPSGEMNKQVSSAKMPSHLDQGESDSHSLDEMPGSQMPDQN